MRGGGEPTWDHEDALGDGAFNLSREEIWGNAEGRERLELEISNRLLEPPSVVWHRNRRGNFRLRKDQA